LRWRVREDSRQVDCSHEIRHHEWDRRDMELYGFLFVTGRQGKGPSLKYWLQSGIRKCIHTGKRVESALPAQTKAGSRSQPEEFVGLISCHQPELHLNEIISADGNSKHNRLIRGLSQEPQSTCFPLFQNST